MKKKALFLPYRIVKNTPEYFICKTIRHKDKKLIPTGSCEKGESLEDCSFREIREELGIKGFANFFPLNLEHEFKTKRGTFCETAFAFEVRGKIKIQKTELESFEFMPRNKATEELEYSFHRQTVKLCHNILEKKTYPKIFILVGPAGSGKDTIIEGALEKNSGIKRIKTIMTRPYKSNDDKKSRISVSLDELKKLEGSGDIIEKNKISDYWFASSYKELMVVLSQGINGIVNVDINGTQYFKKNFSNIITIFISVSPEDLEKRIRKRGRDDESYIKERLWIAKKEIAKSNICDYTIINKEGQVRESITKLLRIIKENK